MTGRSTLSLGLRSGVRVGLTRYDSSILADKRTTFKVELRPRLVTVFQLAFFKSASLHRLSDEPAKYRSSQPEL